MNKPGEGGPEGAKSGDSPNPTPSATVTPESLRAAQDAAESARKETESLKTMIEERDSQTAEFQEKIAALEAQLKERNPGKKIPDAATLAKTLRQQAAAGDVDSIGVLEAAREIAREEYGAASLKERMDASFDQQETFVSEKAKAHKMTVEQMRDALDPFAAAFTSKLPHVQAEKAYSAWAREQSLNDREARITAKEKEMGLYQDPGTDHPGPASKEAAQKKSWRDDKTDAEKRASLGTL